MDILQFSGDGHMVDIVDKPPKNLKKDKIVVVQGGDEDINRMAVSSKFVDVLLDPHVGRKKDFLHHRNSGLNQVLCKLAKENHVAIGFSFSSVLNEKNRAQLIGRMMQNIRLCRKYKVKMVIGSFAKNKWEVRCEGDIQAFFKTIGMTGIEVKMDFVENRLDYKRRYIREGVMLEQ